MTRGNDLSAVTAGTPRVNVLKRGRLVLNRISPAKSPSICQVIALISCRMVRRLLPQVLFLQCPSIPDMAVSIYGKSDFRSCKLRHIRCAEETAEPYVRQVNEQKDSRECDLFVLSPFDAVGAQSQDD